LACRPADKNFVKRVPSNREKLIVKVTGFDVIVFRYHLGYTLCRFYQHFCTPFFIMCVFDHLWRPHHPPDEPVRIQLRNVRAHYLLKRSLYRLLWMEHISLYSASKLWYAMGVFYDSYMHIFPPFHQSHGHIAIYVHPPWQAVDISWRRMTH
jgi:hypothetical protein